MHPALDQQLNVYSSKKVGREVTVISSLKLRFYKSINHIIFD